MPGTLSVCSIVKNEEKLLPAMLESIKTIADEIIIVDTGSTDRTVDIAKSYGARVFYYPWHDNFAAARNFASAQATAEWIFIIDADEVLINPDNIKKYLDASHNKLYMFKIRHISNTSDINREAGCHSNGRIFANNSGFEYYGAVHEHIIQKEEIAVNRVLIEDAEIYHFGFSEIEENLKEKNERNIRLLNREIAKGQEDSYLYYMYFLLGKEYLGLEDFDQALSCFEKCLEMPKIDENVLINTITYMLKIFSIRNHWEKFNDYCQKYAYICHKNPDFCFVYGVFLSEFLKKYNEADFYFFKAMEFKPGNAPYIIYDQSCVTWKPLLFSATNSMHRKNYPTAADYLEKALSYTQGIWQIQDNLIKVYLKLGKKTEAENLLKTFKEIFPENELKNLEKIAYLNNG